MIRHLFLTGEKRVGKSTLLRRLLQALEIEPAGYETRLWQVEGERRGYLFHSFSPIGLYQNDCPCSLRLAVQRSIPVLPVFEEIGALSLSAARESDAPLILMDELGKLEREAHAFQSAVLACLSGGKPVLGVLQKGEYPLEQAIRARGDVRILTVTEQNRDALYPEALETLKNMLLQDAK